VKISDIIKYTEARIVAGKLKNDKELKKAFSSDLMSDVLTLDEENILLITGLANLQLIRTAEMADIHVVLLARGKKASPDMVELAKENGLIILETPFSIYKASGILYSNGLKAVY
jgi:predicted transcriptional regulator